jgi:benzoyl-CoA reductase/2-hydroxyglutaryl-CoA dehydratase subunit BcrC/BadD/HgdB
MRALNEELAGRLAQKRFIGKAKQPRLLVTGSPIIFPNIKIPLLIEEMGGLLVADETCMGERALYDPPVVLDRSFDGMMRALANRCIRPCTCPTFVDNSQRVYRLKQMIRDHKVQGVIYHVLRGCLVYDYEYQIFEEELEKMGIPVIRVESDYNEEDVEQLRIRIEAFIELIKLKDYAERRKLKV